jgi:predicted house-cleaning noncanonical NTP pyrophosphatase (MazG superfamily)
MIERQDVIDKINEILENSDYAIEIKDISDLEDFLNDDENQVLEEYEDIEKLYTEMMDDSDYQME